MANVGVVPLPGAGAAGSRAHGRQPAERDGEDHHQHDAEPVVRHRHARDGDRRYRPVDQRVLEVARDEAEHDTQRKSDHRGGEAEDQRVADGPHHLGRHGAAGGDGGAEIALDRVGEPEHVLHRDRLVEAVFGPHLRLLLGGGVDRHHRRQRVARCDLHQHEADDGDAEGHRDHVEEALDRIREHGQPYLYARAREATAPFPARSGAGMGGRRGGGAYSSMVMGEKSWNQFWA